MPTIALNLPQEAAFGELAQIGESGLDLLGGDGAGFRYVGEFASRGFFSGEFD